MLWTSHTQGGAEAGLQRRTRESQFLHLRSLVTVRFPTPTTGEAPSARPACLKVGPTLRAEGKQFYITWPPRPRPHAGRQQRSGAGAAANVTLSFRATGTSAEQRAPGRVARPAGSGRGTLRTAPPAPPTLTRPGGHCAYVHALSAALQGALAGAGGDGLGVTPGR